MLVVVRGPSTPTTEPVVYTPNRAGGTLPGQQGSRVPRLPVLRDQVRVPCSSSTVFRVATGQFLALGFTGDFVDFGGTDQFV